MSKLTLGCGALACCALLGGVALAQQRSEGRQPAQQQRTETRVESQTTVHRGSVVIGGTVSLQGGHRVGKIEDFIIDDGGCISMIVVAYGEPCLGPVTRAGCGAICPAFRRGCFGCFGPAETPNAAAESRLLHSVGMSGDDIDRFYRTFNVSAFPGREDAR